MKKKITIASVIFSEINAKKLSDSPSELTLTQSPLLNIHGNDDDGYYIEIFTLLPDVESLTPLNNEYLISSIPILKNSKNEPLLVTQYEGLYREDTWITKNEINGAVGSNNKSKNNTPNQILCRKFSLTYNSKDLNVDYYPYFIKIAYNLNNPESQQNAEAILVSSTDINSDIEADPKTKRGTVTTSST